MCIRDSYWRVIGEEKTAHGFLCEDMVMDQLEFAKNLMEEPASFYYGVMWNKLYRQEIIRRHGIQCNEMCIRDRRRAAPRELGGKDPL